MSAASEAEGMVKYQFQIEDEKWAAWKNTVPRTKSLEERLIELIEADTEGRVQEGTDSGAAGEEEGIAPSGSSAAAVETTAEDPGEPRGKRPEKPAAEVSIDPKSADIEIRAALENVQFPEGRDEERCIAAVLAAREYLRQRGEASMRDFVTDVMPVHSLGYDVPDLEPGDRYRGSWWRKVVRPGLEALPDVEPPSSGGQGFRWGGDSAEPAGGVYDPTEDLQ